MCKTVYKFERREVRINGPIDFSCESDKTYKKKKGIYIHVYIFFSKPFTGLSFTHNDSAANNTSQDIQVCCSFVCIILPDLGVLKIPILKS